MGTLEDTRCWEMLKTHSEWRDLINTSGIQVSYQRGHKFCGQPTCKGYSVANLTQPKTKF